MIDSMPKRSDTNKLWPNEPYLVFPDYKGNYFEEYIPYEYTKNQLWLREQYCLFKYRHNLNVYYWELRWMLEPLDRKLKDLEFINHVYDHHKGKPKIFMEKVYLFFARRLYMHEYNLLIGLENEHMLLKKNNDDIYLEKHPYIQAYKKRWRTRPSDDNQWNTLYHGVTIDELDFFFESIIRKGKSRVDYYSDLRNKIKRQNKKNK